MKKFQMKGGDSKMLTNAEKDRKVVLDAKEKE